MDPVIKVGIALGQMALKMREDIETLRRCGCSNGPCPRCKATLDRMELRMHRLVNGRVSTR